MTRQPLSFEEYQSARYFPALDGFRAASCLLIITWHAEFLGWEGLNGYSGVAAFFVLSGYLITTLALREEARRGMLSLKAFYVRRAFRIFPGYYAVLILYCVLIYGLDLSSSIEKRPALDAALPYYLTYMNEYSAKPSLAATGAYPPFFHSWSLGIEEKFYLIWPVLAFALLHKNRLGRIALASVIIALSYVFYDSEVVGLLKLSSYVAILLGCILAVLMEQRASYNVLSKLASTPVHVALLMLLIGTHLSQEFGHKTVSNTIYPYVVALFLIGLVAGRTPCASLFQSRVLSYLGLRTYGLYLVHVLAQNAVEMIAKPGPRVPLWSSPLYFLACLAVTLVAAEILHRTVEMPFIALGKRISNRIVSTESAPPVVERQPRPLLPVIGNAQRE